MCKPTLPPIPESIKLLSFNVENLEPKLNDPHFLDLLNKHDLCILCETWKKDESKLNLPGFWDFSQIRPKVKKIGRYSGGITVLAKNDIRKGVKVSLSTEGLLWIKLDKLFFSFSNNLFLCGGYFPPERSRNSVGHIDFFGKLAEQTSNFSQNGNVLLAGDFNARLGVSKPDQHIPILDDLMPDNDAISNTQRSSCDHIVNNYGKKFNQMCNILNLKVANGQVPGDLLGNYTCFHRGCSLVDLIVVDPYFLNYIRRLTVLPPEFNSTHAPLSLDICCSPQIDSLQEEAKLAEPPPKLVWDSNKADIFEELIKSGPVQEKLHQLSDIFSTNPNIATVEGTLGEFCDILVSTASKCMKLVPSKKKPIKNKFPKTKKWYDSECFKLKRKLRTVSTLLQKSPTNPYAQGNFIKAKKDYRRLLRAKKMKFESDSISKLESLCHDPKAFWNHVKFIKSTCKPSNASHVTTESWVNHFASLNKKDPSSLTDNSQVFDVKNNLNFLLNKQSLPCSVLDKVFTNSEVSSAIRKLKSGKATAMDIVSNDILKASSPYIVDYILQLFNYILSSEIFPDIWGLGIIFPLFKSGEQDDPNNYRGISINSSLSKLFTQIMNDRLTTFTENNNVIHFNQLGFRKGYRTADHVFTLKTLIDQSLFSKKELHVCFVDFRKAYDTVWRDGLFLKLLGYGVSPKFVRILKSMYSTLSCCIRLPFGLSQQFPSLTGLRQGCNMSPLLFNIFINDFIDSLVNTESSSPMLNNIPISCLLYADDLVLISESSSGLQNLLNSLHTFTNKWFLEVNPIKTKTMIFSRKRKLLNSSFFIGSAPIAPCDSYCYLGCTFTKNGTFKLASETLYEKATKAMYGVLNTFYKYSNCPIKFMLKLFDSLVVPIALYNSEVWGPLCFTKNANQVNIFGDVVNSPESRIQYKYLKRILGVGKNTSHWALLSETGSFPLRTRIMTQMLRYWLHLYTSPNPILTAALICNTNLSFLHNTWFSQVKKLMTFLNIHHILYTTDLKEINYQIRKSKSIIKIKFLDYWKSERARYLGNGGKLDFYLKFKDKFCQERYLSVLKLPNKRRSMTRFRMSSHRLPIELGRYKGLDREKRICHNCNNGVGDEQHYLFICSHPTLITLRSKFFKEVTNIYPEFATIPQDQQVIYIMQNDNPTILTKLSSFLHGIDQFFKELIV